MAVDSGRIPVGTSAAKLSPVATDTLPGSTVLIKNIGAATVDVGGPNVTAGGGFPLATGDAIKVKLDQIESTYGIASATASLAWFAEGI